MTFVAGSYQPYKLVNIQVLRFIAAALVVYAHAVDVSQISGGFSILSYGNLENFGAIGVDIFFVISGFIITKTAFIDKEMLASQFMLKRILRVVPIYFLLSLPWLALSLRNGVDAPALVATLTFWPAFGSKIAAPVLFVGWSLCFEMLFYCLTAIYIAFKGKIAFALIMILFAGAWIMRDWFDAPSFQFLGNPLILEFLFGVGVAIIYPRISRKAGLIAGAAGISWIAATLIFGFGRISEAEDILTGHLSLMRVELWGIPAMLIVLSALATETHKSGKLWAFFVFLGDASYSIYLVHPTLFFLLKKIAPKVPTNPDVVIVLCMFLGILAGALVYRFIERPLTKALAVGSFAKERPADV